MSAPVPHQAPLAALQSLPTAALSAVVLTAPTVAFADDSSAWVPALSAVGAGFAIGLAARGSAVQERG